MIADLLLLLVSAVLVNNFVLARFLGLCPFFGVSKKTETALGMGMAVIFVIVVACAVTWLIERFILVPFDVVFLRTIAFILVIAGLVQFVEMVVKKTNPALYQSLGVFLPLITTNCAVLGAALLVIQKEYNFIEMLVFSFGASAGFTLAIVIFSGVRERMALARIPKNFQGIAIAMITASVLSLAFMGFSAMVK